MKTIYVIMCIVNGKYYVGQTTLDPPSLRWKCHISVANGKFDKLDPLITRSIRKYRPDAFTIEYYTLHEGASQNLLNQMECLAIVKYNSMHPKGYNLKEGGSHGTHHKETRLKISKMTIGILRGPCSKERRLAISKAKKGITLGPMSQIQKDAISTGLKGKPWSSVRRAAYEARWGKQK